MLYVIAAFVYHVPRCKKPQNQVFQYFKLLMSMRFDHIGEESSAERKMVRRIQPVQIEASVIKGLRHFKYQKLLTKARYFERVRE